MRLREFREQLKKLTGDSEDARPFVCNGDPYACRAFVVGINPASSVPFWPFWSDETGFDKDRWFSSYKAIRRAEPPRPGRTRRLEVSPTRRNLNHIGQAASPIRVLETNLYAKPTAEAAELAQSERQTKILDFLLDELRPQVVLLHGKEPVAHFKRAFGLEVGPDFQRSNIAGRSVQIAGVQNLSRGVSQATAERLGHEIRKICTAIG